MTTIFYRNGEKIVISKRCAESLKTYLKNNINNCQKNEGFLFINDDNIFEDNVYINLDEVIHIQF
jgi:hypothetical protein